MNVDDPSRSQRQFADQNRTSSLQEDEPSFTISAALQHGLLFARLMLILERLWPSATLAFSLLGLFLIYAWSPIPAINPAPLRVIILGVFFVAFIAIIFRAFRVVPPSQREVLRHLDAAIPETHQRAQTLLDRPSGASTTEIADALWRAHQKATAETLPSNLLTEWRSDLAERDPYALRYHIVLIAVVMGLLAGPEKFTRLLSAFSLKDANAITAPFPMEGWIDPPSYTGSPPIFLQFASIPDDRMLKHQVPVGSSLVLKNTTQDAISVTSDPQFEEIKTTSDDNQTKEKRWRVKGNGLFTIKTDDHPTVTLSLTVIPDNAPSIIFQEIREQKRGSVTFAYQAHDDYGLKNVTLKVLGRASKKGAADKEADPLREPPSLTLPVSKHTKDVASDFKLLASMIHPAWQGTEVRAELMTEDEAGQVATTPPFLITLPDHPHTDRLAQALDEQGRTLLQNSHERLAVLADLALLSQTPDLFNIPTGAYLGLRLTKRDIDQAGTREALRDAGDSLLALADIVDQSFKSDARRALDAARERLREALDQKADKDTIQERLKEFREALDRYLEDYTKRALKQKPQSQPPMAQSKPLRQKDLNALLDRMGELLKKEGNIDPLFQSLESLLDSLQAGEANPQIGEGDPSESLDNDLDRLTRDQQKLRDETFRDSNKDGSSNQDALKNQQQGLRESLKQLKEALKKNGLPSGEAFDDAEQAMRDAESALGQGDGRNAVRQQEQALKSLRRGAKALAEARDQNGDGQGRPGSMTGRNGTGTQKDPFGREIGKGTADEDLNQDYRAGSERNKKLLDILKELQSRSGDPSRPLEERDYLKRLLELDSRP